MMTEPRSILTASPEPASPIRANLPAVW